LQPLREDISFTGTVEVEKIHLQEPLGEKPKQRGRRQIGALGPETDQRRQRRHTFRERIKECMKEPRKLETRGIEGGSINKIQK